MVVDCNHIQFVDYTAAQGIKDLITQFEKREQIIVLYKAKPSLIRTLTGVMPSFRHCLNEEQLEEIVGKFTRAYSSHCRIRNQHIEMNILI